jgi:hydrogenase expression/formation protein HypD
LYKGPEIVSVFRDPDRARFLLEEIRSVNVPATIMEVCGTHTVALFRSGIRYALPETVRLVSGPGCPVCVTPSRAVEKVIRLACRKDVVIFCFGDMMKVPGK